MRNRFILFAFLSGFHVFAWEATDSLSHKSYAYFEEATFTLRDPAKNLIYGKAWLTKAKKEQNYRQQAAALHVVMYASDKKLFTRYLDTLLQTAEKSADPQTFGKAWLRKGIYHYGEYQHQKALDCYLKADKFFSQTGDAYDVFKLKYAIATTKYYLGFYDEAIALLNQCKVYFSREDARGYLNTLHALALCHTQLKNFEESARLNTEGLRVGEEVSENAMRPYFELSQGINAYYVGDYKGSLAKLNYALPLIDSRNDIPNTAVTWFYLGKTHHALGHDALAISYFHKVDRSFGERRYIRPDLREAYELLIRYYERAGDQKQQLYYTNRLLKVDSVLTADFRYLSGKITKEYDTRELLRSKTRLEGDVKTRDGLVMALAGLFILTTAILLTRHFRLQAKYRSRYQELMARQPAQKDEPEPFARAGVQDFSPEFLMAAQKGLERFEHDRKYLTRDMDLQKLAGYLNTNMKYASRLVLYYRNKKTIEYIRDLKVDHIVELLKAHGKYRNYTDKALAEEAGFGSTQNFTRAFKARNGMPPRYFISQLKKDAEKGEN